MFLRVDKLQIELPAPAKQDPNAAAALQELRCFRRHVWGERTHAGQVISRCLGHREIGGDAVRPTPPYRRAMA